VLRGDVEVEGDLLLGSRLVPMFGGMDVAEIVGEP
jgi:hypothetical protein